MYPCHRIVSSTGVHPCYHKLYENIKHLESNINNYDYIVISPRNDHNQKYINKIIGITRKADTPLVLVDISDILEYRPILFSEKTIKYFKREFIPPIGKKIPIFHKIRSRLNSAVISCKYYWNNPKFATILPSKVYTPKIIPFFLGISDINSMLNIKPNTKTKTIDVSFIARPNNPLRRKIFLKLVELKKEYDLNIIVGSGFSLEEYYQIISTSKISISVPGLGFDTFRYYEIPYFKTALVSFKLPIQIPNNFENWKSAVFFNSIQELEDIILKLLTNQKWKHIGTAGHKKLMKRFIDIKVAEYFLEKLEEGENA